MTTSAQQLYDEAVALHRAGQLQQAELCYRELLRAHPQHAECLHLLGALLVQCHGARQYKEAVQLIRAAIQLAPANARYRRSLGVAHEAAQQWDAAADAFERAIQKQPDDVQTHMRLAHVLKAAERPARAAEAYRAALSLQPRHPTANYKLGSVLKQLGRLQAAADAFRQHLAIDPGHEQAAFWLAAVTSDPSCTQCPPALVAHLFDGYASHFDEHLLHKLHYKTPNMLMDCIHRAAAMAAPADSSSASTTTSSSSTTQQLRATQQSSRWSRCVDLGCGTGLMGPLLRQHTAHLSGVDLSQGMVAKARERGCYDELGVGELVQHLTTAAALQSQGVPRYDLLVAADVFVYLGDLTPVFRAAAAAAADGALFAFSTELLQQAGAPDEQQQQPYALQATGRCSHAPAHLRDVAAQCGWRVLLLEEAELRKNAGQPILGCLCVMQLRSLRN